MNLAMKSLREKLSEVLQDGFKEEAVKAFSKSLKDAFVEAESDFEYYVKEDLSYNLAAWVQSMATDAIEAILKGDDDQMRCHLKCQENQYTGRDREHPVIHGKLFETGAIELRKQIVDAHADLLKSERILDLEDQVRSLVLQVVDAEQKREAMWERLRSYE